MIDAQTAHYYEQQALAYANATVARGVSSSMTSFCKGLPYGATIIDLGCGGGRDLLELRRRRYEAVGLDSSKGLADIASAYSGCPVIIADMVKMPIATGSFDAAWASASLLHLDTNNVRYALGEIRRILRSGGRFFSSVKRGEGTRRDETGRMFTYYSERTWISLVGEADFSISEITSELDEKESNVEWIRVLACCS